MRHLNGHRKLGRSTPHRRAMFRNMATSIVLHERVDTTLAKAKEIRGIVEKLVTAGKRGTLADRRRVGSYLFDKEATKKLFDELAPRFKERPGGYLRILRQGARASDSAQMATIQFVDFDFSKKQKKTKKAESAE